MSKRSLRSAGSVRSDDEVLTVAQLMSRGVALDHYRDDSIEPYRARVRALSREIEVGDEDVVMARMLRAPGGASRRTFMGGRTYENGLLCSRKAGRMLHWEGGAARALLVRSESDHGVTRIASEAITLVGGDHEYTVDAVLTLPDGTEHAVEVKRDLEELRDPEYRRKLAWAAEIFRRCGIRFSIVLREEVFRSARHRRNAELIASRGFVHVPRRRRDELADLAARSGTASTLGEVAETLAPGRRLRGMAMAHALIVARRLEIDVTDRLDERTPVTIH